jgi:hypothetical protein
MSFIDSDDITDKTRPAPELPEDYHESDGGLWRGDKDDPQLLAYLDKDGTLSFNFMNYDPSEAKAMFIWLQRRMK